MPTLCSVKTPITQNGGGNRQIQAQLAKYKNLQIVETTASVPTKYFNNDEDHQIIILVAGMVWYSRV